MLSFKLVFVFYSLRKSVNIRGNYEMLFNLVIKNDNF